MPWIVLIILFLFEEIIQRFRIGFELDIPEDSFAIILARGAVQERDSLDAQIEPLLRNWKLSRLSCCTRLI